LCTPLITREPRSINAIVVPTALFCVSLPTPLSVIAANFCPAWTTKPNKLNNVVDGSVKGKLKN
jgi:hypothetical protein